MLPFAIFGIHNSALNLAVELVILFLVVIWFALVFWTYADAHRRVADPLLITCATLASLFPFVGTIVYMILRPPEYLEDVRERELEMQAAEARLHDLDHGLCPHCDYRVERDFVRCPSCLRKLKERCVSCSRPLDQAWTICPYCETEVPAAAPARRPRRKRATSEHERSEIGQPALESERTGPRGQPAIESERTGSRRPESWLDETAADDRSSALAPDGEEVRAVSKPVAASEPAAKSRSAGRASRPRPTS